MRENQFSLQDVMKMGIEIGVQTAIKEINSRTMENIKSREDRRLHNTKLLLENYKIIKLKCIKDSTSGKAKKQSPIDILEDIETLMDPNKELILESIQRSMERTKAMVKYIEDTLKLYQVYAKHCKGEELRKYTVMALSYISKHSRTNEDIAIMMNVDASTVSRNKADAIKTYSRFLWGVDNTKLVNSMHKRCT